MIFDLLAWIYISLICFAWGRLFVKYCSPGMPELNFYICCFIGFAIIGIISLYFSLFGPLYVWLKLLISVPALIFYLRLTNRRTAVNAFAGSVKNLSPADGALLSVCILMLLFLSSSVIIHPDTLNYHAESIFLFDHHGMIRGIANLKPEYGFQSLWFTTMAFFDFSFLQPRMSFPLNGCLLFWFISFLISKSADQRNDRTVGWYLLLLLFTLFSWTQIRLTASSASPDFIVALCIFLSVYFLCGKDFYGHSKTSYYFATFSALIAVSIKLSAVAILAAVVFIMILSLLNRQFRFFFSYFALVLICLLPLVIRNIFASGYPLYPSSFAGIFPVYWKMDAAKLLHFQHYITSYARYPVDTSIADDRYRLPIASWLPAWWRHLYISDKILLLLIATGAIADLLFLKIWKRGLTMNRTIALCTCITGAIVWFTHAPDPRFGTGFLIPLLYFQYAPFIHTESAKPGKMFTKGIAAIKWIAAVLVLLYIGYRSIYFFHPDQVIYPEGIKTTDVISLGTFYHTLY